MRAIRHDQGIRPAQAILSGAFRVGHSECVSVQSAVCNGVHNVSQGMRTGWPGRLQRLEMSTMRRYTTGQCNGRLDCSPLASLTIEASLRVTVFRKGESMPYLYVNVQRSGRDVRPVFLGKSQVDDIRKALREFSASVAPRHVEIVGTITDEQAEVTAR